MIAATIIIPILFIGVSSYLINRQERKEKKTKLLPSGDYTGFEDYITIDSQDIIFFEPICHCELN